MTGLDTNVLVRYIVQDDTAQSEKANHCIERAIREEEALFINRLVLCELVWVLSRAYRFSKETIVGLLEKILVTSQFEIEDKNIVWRALSKYKDGGADFADCLIGEVNSAAGCVGTLTLDVSAGQLATFEML
jgi:predicted nucleic-acid-binding protein